MALGTHSTPPSSLSEFSLAIRSLWLTMGKFGDCGQGATSCPLLTAGEGRREEDRGVGREGRRRWGREEAW